MTTTNLGLPGTTDARARAAELRKTPKATLVGMHINRGGLMGREVYRRWTKDELVNVILECEGLDPWA